MVLDNGVETGEYSFRLYSTEFIGTPYGDEGGDVFELVGVAGQSNIDPPPLFDAHWVLEYNNQIYDPSYGLGPYSESEHENEFLAGSQADLGGIDKVRPNDPGVKELNYILVTE